MSNCNCHNHKKEENKVLRKLQFFTGILIFIVAITLSLLLELNTYFKFTLFLVCYIILGAEIIVSAIKNIARGKLFDENFLMSIATIGAFILGDYAEAVAVMLFYQIGEYFQHYAVEKSKSSITALMDLRPDYANLKTVDGIIKCSPSEVEIGAEIVVMAGEKIPLDGIVLQGEAMLDTSMLTGEFMPRAVAQGDAVYSGCINLSGALTIGVKKVYSESTVAKILELVENAPQKPPTERFITKFSTYYTPVVVFLAVLIAILPPIIGGYSWTLWGSRALIFLVISCPCALVISVPLAFFAGLGAASKQGILIKGGAYIEALARLDTAIFDKTGTLTTGKPIIKDIITAGEIDADTLLKYAAHAESMSNHPIAKAIVSAYKAKPDTTLLKNVIEIAGQGISVEYDSKRLLAGNIALMRAHDIEVVQLSGTVVYLAYEEKYLGCIILEDEIKADSKLTIAKLKEWNMKTVMLTGDTETEANNVAQRLGLDEYHAALMPHEKVESLLRQKKESRAKGTLAFVGDGINDAPVLNAADVGIAMGGLGSDAAIEAADVVIMTDEPSRLLTARKISKRTQKTVWQNIVFALSVKLIFLVLGIFGISTMLYAVFADVGVSLLAVLNSIRILKTKHINP